MSKPIIIYWSGRQEDNSINEISENMIYYPPENLFKSLLLNKNKELGDDETNFFLCPSFKDKTKNTFVFKNTLTSSIDLIDGKLFPNENTTIPFSSVRESTLNNTFHLLYSMSWLFFCEQSINVSFTSPYFSCADYLPYMQTCPGSFDIGRWFRPYQTEFVVWNKNQKITINENDPLMYAEFHTNKKIIFKRFQYTSDLHSYWAACNSAPLRFGKKQPLSKRYERFEKASMDKAILKIIKNNLLED